jgi:mannose-6-phosphate isomerase-like protein (cupin superfamily)
MFIRSEVIRFGLFLFSEKSENSHMSNRYHFEKWLGYLPPNPAMIRFNLESEGYQVFQWSERPGAFYGPHKHEQDQVHWVMSGCLEITVKNVGVFRLGPGDRDFMPAETYHAAEVIGDEPVLYFIGEKLPPPKKKRGRPKKVK